MTWEGSRHEVQFPAQQARSSVDWQRRGGAAGRKRVRSDGRAATQAAIQQAQQCGDWVVGIHGTPNVNVVNQPTVKSAQSGAWSVAVSNAPTIAVGNEPNVDAKQSGNWNVAVSNAPTVAVGNQPTVNANQNGAWSVNVATPRCEAPVRSGYGDG